MWMAAATRRASCRSSMEQQLPKEVCPSLWSYSCIDRPMTSCPCSASSAAATDESTPPDMATTIRMSKTCRDHEDTKKKNHSSSSCSSSSFRVFVVALSGHCLPSQAAKLLDESRQHLDHAVHFFFRRKHAEAEAERALRPVRRQSHCPQHVRRLERAGRTGGPCGHRHALEIERDQQTLRLDPFEADVRRVWHARFRRAVHRRAGHGAENARFEAIPKSGDAWRFDGQLSSRQPRGDAEAGDGRHVFRPGAAVPFVLAPGQPRLPPAAPFP